MFYTSYASAEGSVSLYGSPRLNANSIGCLLPLSGKYELVGRKALRGVLVAADAPDYRSDVQIVVKDIGNDREAAEESFEEIVYEDGVSAVIGPLPSDLFGGIGRTVESLKIPTVVFPVSQVESVENPYIIEFSYPVEKQADVLAGYAVESVNIRTFGILHPKTRLGELFKNAFIKSVMARGGEVKYVGSYDSKLSNIPTEIEWIKSVSPQAIFIPDGATRSVNLIMTLKADRDLGDLFFLGPNTWNSRAFVETVGREMDGVVFRAVFTDFFYSGTAEWINFSEKFKALFGDEIPGFLEYQVYKAVKLILKGLKAPIKSRDDILARLFALRDDPEFVISKNTNGSIEISPKPLVLTVTKGKVTKVK